MTTSYPLAFKPVCIGEDCFIDGGLLNNFPLNDCFTRTGCAEEDVLAFKNIWHNATKGHVTNESSIIDYVILLMKKMQGEICSEKDQPIIKNLVECEVEGLTSMSDWITAISTEEMRATLVAKGEAEGARYFQRITHDDVIFNV
jgi:hypothetical protein